MSRSGGSSEARVGTTPDAIVDAALALIDEEGFHALSMRKLATRLGVFPTSVYWHVGNRTQLLGLVCERVLSQIELPDDEVPWRDWLFAFSVRTRQVIGAHPRFAGYFVTNIQTSRQSIEIAERVLATLQRAGFAGNELVRAYNAGLGAVFGWISGEFADGSERDAASARTAIEDVVFADDAEAAYPTIRALWPTAANRAFMLRWDSGTASPLESSYETMLTALLDGFEAQLRRQ